MKIKNLLIICMLILVASCKDDSISEDSTDIPMTTQTTNKWIRDIMRDVYLWEDQIPEGLNPYTEADPFSFFDKFVYTEEDHWSWVSDDYYNTENLYSGVTTTSGIEFYLTLIGDNYSVIGVVEYVMPDSPGEAESIKRGDVFTSIDGTSLNLDNYYDLVTKGGSYTLTLANVIDNILVEKTTVDITEVEDFQENPILVDTVYEIGNKKIGYLIYNSFLADYNDEKSLVFSDFKAGIITDMIIDLRYNGGGSVAAEEHLANLIAPASAIGEIFSKDHYNALYTAYFEEQYGTDGLKTRISAVESNINLTGKLIGLTSSSTASASEGLLNGLSPLLDLTLIGDTTHGKYTGMWVLPDDDDDPEWAIIPIVVQGTNKNDVSVKGGMIPDILLSDDPLDGYQLGDIRETMLSKAIEQITGTPVVKNTHISSRFNTTPISHFNGSNEIKPLPRVVGWGNDLLIKK